MLEEPYDAGNPAHVRGRIKASKLWDDQRTEVIVGLMSTEPGRRWVHEYLTHCQVGQNPFNPDPIKMAFNCGGLNAGQVFMTWVMNADPRLYLQMMDEAVRRDKETEKENSDA